MISEKTIEDYIQYLLNKDSEITILYSRIAMEKDEVCRIIIEEFTKRGIFSVKPFSQAKIIRLKTI